MQQGFFEVPAGARRRSRLHDQIPAETLPALEQLQELVAGLPDPADLNAEQRAGAVTTAHRVQVMLEAYLTATAGAADQNKDSQLFAAGTTGTMIASLIHQNPAVGSGIVARAKALRDMPATEAAYRAGTISGRHVQLLVEAAEHLDGFTDPKAETPLVELGALVEPAALAAVVKTLIEQSRPKAPDEDYLTARERRRISFTELPDATWQIKGILDPVAGRRLRDAFATFTDQRSPDDPRSAAQRRADALDDIVAAGVASTSPMGTSGVLISADLDTLTEGHGAKLDDMPIGPDLFDLLTCSGILNIILGRRRGSAFVPLMHGRAKRRATAAQWAALIVRDGGCANCGKHWRFTEAHHVVHWRDGGETDVSNMCLFCSRCHHDLHLGYLSVEMIDGLPVITVIKSRTRRR